MIRAVPDKMFISFYSGSFMCSLPRGRGTCGHTFADGLRSPSVSNDQRWWKSHSIWGGQRLPQPSSVTFTTHGDAVKPAKHSSLVKTASCIFSLNSSALSQLLHLEPHMLSSPNSSEYEKRLAGLQAQLRESLASYQAELLGAQTRIAELEGQVS